MQDPVKAFLAESSSLIIDQSSSARVGIKKLLTTMGVPLRNIFEASSYEEAEELIRREKPKLVFCDFQIGGKFGLDLVQRQREEHSKETKDCIFVLVTSNTSQSAVAQAAEEDVDAYILKPYTVDSFTLSLTRSIQIKVQPTDYLKLIDQGKDSLGRDMLDEAMSLFESAMEKDSKPSLACFYEGLVYSKKTSLDNSQESYQKGLAFNKIHYKCLTGLFDILMLTKKYDAAYEIVQKIVRFFPANPKRLSTVLRLAVQTKHYADIDSFYDVFLKIEERNDELVKSVCAALIVCAKHFFEDGNADFGVDLVRKATVTSAGRKLILKKAVETLIQYNQVDEAKSVLKRFSMPLEGDDDYAVSSFLVMSKESEPSLIASRGEELIRKGIREKEVYRITIENLAKFGFKERSENLQKEAEQIFPELKDEFKKSA